MTLFLRFVIDGHISRPVSEHPLEPVKFFCRISLLATINCFPLKFSIVLCHLGPHRSPNMPPWTDLERSRLLLAMIELLVPPKSQNKLPPWAEVAERMGAGFTQDAVRYFSRRKKKQPLSSYVPPLTISIMAMLFSGNNTKSCEKKGFRPLAPLRIHLNETEQESVSLRG